ncbi:aspartyl/asparaginyl beta-hydroxylase domain-containing protein [Catellatospora chokoriensis]|uniref:Aspartyl/asparaginy/proline hydroxylase domain-containing protein n=1 Tax=Catellatospora chokoriensis TaxID=310353 RepID=A0A8J3K781_9ACTN|nr:aspartyl/asparaginyl beta-hydroxylase domain-containing protein [Catellatospora chokoriensis]GIF94147.1 hypothetical protein Cch02nite_75910 [Catellatospora chokoriensis]
MSTHPDSSTTIQHDRLDGLVDAAGAELTAAGPMRYRGAAYLPELDGGPWFDPSAWQWAASVEDAWPEIRHEFETMAAQAVTQEYRQPFDADRHAPGRPATGGSGGWDVVFLQRHGTWVKRNADLFPATRATLVRSPIATGEAMFSVLGPGQRILPHSSGCNLVVTCHLPLDVPPGAGICVAGQNRTWTEGAILAFDDSWLHRAWNDADRPRVVLIWDVWHPGLTADEVDRLSGLLPRLMPDIEG